MFDNVYRGKKVLITGHTGFKGSWLAAWLIKLGARVIGVSRDIPTEPSMFEVLQMEERLEHHIADIRDLEKLEEIIDAARPDFIFHLAAQAIVSTSYKDPLETLSTNVMGTANILDLLKRLNYPCTAVMITSDKCYDNVEQVWGYKENDPMGGKDIYSGSKGAAELVIKSYFHSFFTTPGCKVRLGIGRAGNVIGGGDWAADRIVVDCMRAWSRGEAVEIRSPDATRPWQHVLEPLSGYLNLGEHLSRGGIQSGEAFNFGPRAEQNRTVLELLDDLKCYWDFPAGREAYRVTDNIPFHEAGLLKLNCDKALFYLKWQATLEYGQTIRFVSEWYYDYYIKQGDMFEKTMSQISEYETEAKKRGSGWAC